VCWFVLICLRVWWVLELVCVCVFLVLHLMLGWRVAWCWLVGWLDDWLVGWVLGWRVTWCWLVGWLRVLCLMVDAWSGGLVSLLVGVCFCSCWLASVGLQAMALAALAALAAACCPGCLAALKF
jgi:hypothetical protein